MKRYLALTAVLILVFLEYRPATALSPLPCPTLSVGQMIKVEGKSSIYVVNNKGEFLYMPNGDVFKSWNSDEKYGGYYTTISQACFGELQKTPTSPPGGINFRPGSYVVKRPSSSQLYVVLPYNTLAKITPTAAKALYGATFRPRVIDGIFWANYVNSGPDITIAKPPNGMLVKHGGKIWYVNGTSLHELPTEGFVANRFKAAFVRPVTDAMIVGMSKAPSAVRIGGFDAEIADRTQTTRLPDMPLYPPRSPGEPALSPDERRISDLQQLQLALAKFFENEGSYPIGSGIILGEGSVACLNSDGWQGADNCPYPIFAAVPKDPGGKAYVYTGSGFTYTVEATLDGTINGLSGAIRLTPGGITQ